jgi:hypothetical protein
MKMGWYSNQAIANGCGSSFWRKPDGTVVEVTGVGSETCPYEWADRVCLGEVTEWVRTGVLSAEEQRKMRDVDSRCRQVGKWVQGR